MVIFIRPTRLIQKYTPQRGTTCTEYILTKTKYAQCDTYVIIP